MTDLSCTRHNVLGRLRLVAQSAAGVDFLGNGDREATGPHHVVERMVAHAIGQGLIVTRLDLRDDDESLPLGDTPPDHVGRLRALRDRLVGPDKAAVRWALNRLSSTDENLAEIRRLAGK